MDTITNAASNAASTASKLIWGEGKTESGEEPVSGQQGEGSKTEPFDQGNKDDGAAPTINSTSTNPTSTEAQAPTFSEGLTGSSSAGVGDTPTHSAQDPAPSSTEGQTATSSSAVGNAPSSTEAQEPAGQTATSSTAVGDPSSAPGSGGPAPNIGTDVTESQTPVQKQQGADKPNDEPTGAQTDAVKESKDAGEAAMAKRDPNDHSGEPLKVPDGSEKKEDAADTGKPSEEQSKSEGTGEQWVKSTGLAADGGDFDATKPGAGKEADRLLEQKGIHKTEGNKGPPQDIGASSGGGDESKAKPKLTEKIKEKLHIGKH